MKRSDVAVHMDMKARWWSFTYDPMRFTKKVSRCDLVYEFFIASLNESST